MATLDRRVQVLFDPEQYAALERLASATNKSVGAIVREAVSDRLRASTTDKQAALARLLARADSPTSAPIDWEKEKDAFEWDLPS
jgi:hypothetical protein